MRPRRAGAAGTRRARRVPGRCRGRRSLRTRHGFIVCQRRDSEGFVDDFTVESPGTWDADGAALLLTAAERLVAGDGVGAVRVVTAHAHEAKAGMLAGLSLSLAEQWWVRELTPTSPPTALGRISGPGFSGVLVAAPPVYDPGGPVFDADRVEPGAGLDAIERTAAAAGAVLAVLPAAPGVALTGDLRRRGWHVASDWYVGWPAVQ